MFIIIFGIVGLILIPQVVNQLWITLIETVVLSLYLIVLLFIERWQIHKIFQYTVDA